MEEKHHPIGGFLSRFKVCVCVCVCVYVCVCVCIYVCVCVWCSGCGGCVVCSGCVLGSGPEGLEFKPHTQAAFHLVFHLPPTSPRSPPSCDWVPGIYWVANSRPFLMKQQWSRWDFRVPTSLAVRTGLCSCESS